MRKGHHDKRGCGREEAGRGDTGHLLADWDARANDVPQQVDSDKGRNGRSIDDLTVTQNEPRLRPVRPEAGV